MKKIITLFFLLILGFQAGGQTALSAGEIVFLGFNVIGSSPAKAPNYISLLVRKPIDVGTKIRLTNQNWNGSGFDAPLIPNGKTYSLQGTLEITFNEPISIGQVIEINFSNSVTDYHKTSVGTIDFVSGNLFDFGADANYDQLYIFQTAPSVSYISGLSWDSNPTSRPPGIDFSTASSQNSFNAQISGSSVKCGTWKPTTVGGSIDFTANLSTTFYNSSSWLMENSNSISTGYCSCNPDSIAAGVTNIYNEIESNIVFLKYKYTTSGVWRQYNGSSWSSMPTAPDWGSNTRTREVIIKKSLSLGTSCGSDVFEVAHLVVEDSIDGENGVTLTIESGNSLKVHYGLDFVNPGGKKPKIHLKSEFASGAPCYATLFPTGANLGDLDGNFQYTLHVERPGWHHFMSPISARFDSVEVLPVNKFSFVAGPVGTGNFFGWNASVAQWEAVLKSDNFSSRPYTIFFTSSEVPCDLVVRGPLLVADQDNVMNNTAVYYNPVTNPTTGSSGNVPGWTLDGDDGWNFYGNPYINSIATNSLLRLFASNGSELSNKMTGLDNKIYVWQPGTSISNLIADYRYKSKSSGSGSFAGDSATTLLAPFQAFFMRRSDATTNNSTNTKGFVHSKKYRSTEAHTASNTILNKTQSQDDQRVLTLTKTISGEKGSIFLGNGGKERLVNLSSDILAGMYKETGLAFAYDSMLFAVKFWPIAAEDTSSIPVLVSHPTPGETFKLSSSDPNTFLLDKALNVLHSFQQGDYMFTHQTAYNASPRFTWIFAGNATVGLEEELWQPEPVVVSYGEGWVKFSYSEDVEFTLVDMQGKTLETGRFQNGEYTLETASMPAGLYTIMSNAFSSKFIVR